MNEELEVTELQTLVRLGKNMEGLTNTPEFKELFYEGYVDAFAITNARNFKFFDRDARVHSVELLIARSEFVNYINDVIQAGQTAQEDLAAISEES